jgi:hypothetical protein
LYSYRYGAARALQLASRALHLDPRSVPALVRRAAAQAGAAALDGAVGARFSSVDFRA